MTLSRQSLEILLDLIEIKASSLQIQGRDDARELNKLRKCRQELQLELHELHANCPKKILNPPQFPKKPCKASSLGC